MTPTLTSRQAPTDTPTPTPTGTLGPAESLTQTPTATATSTEVVSTRRSEDNQDKETKKTDKERQDEQLTNDSGRDDVHTEGQVVGVERSPDGTSLLVTIALGPGGQERLVVEVPCSSRTCPDIQAGDYVEADGYQNGVGDPDSYFVAADGITIQRNGQTVR